MLVSMQIALLEVNIYLQIGPRAIRTLESPVAKGKLVIHYKALLMHFVVSVVSGQIWEFPIVVAILQYTLLAWHTRNLMVPLFPLNQISQLSSFHLIQAWCLNPCFTVSGLVQDHLVAI